MPSKGLKNVSIGRPPDLTDNDFAPATPAPLTDADFQSAPKTLGPDYAIQEMPDDVSFYDRAVVKNFSNSPEASVKYLKEQYPDYEVIHHKGEILMKKNGEQSYKTLDPSKPWMERLAHPIDAIPEAVMDLTDIGYDVGSGVGTTAASTAAGVAGGVATLPAGGWGAVPAAMGAGAATSGSLEALRQKIGQYLGLDQDVSGKDVAISTALGAAAPLVMGTGAGANTVAKVALEKGLSQEAAQTLLNQQSGLFGRALPYIGEAASGIPADTLRTARNRLPELKALENEGVTDLVTSTGQNLSKAVRQSRQQTGKELETVIDNAGQKVDISGAKQKLLDHLQDLKDQYSKDSGLGNDALKDEIDLAEQNIKNIFSRTEEAPKNLYSYTNEMGQKVSAPLDAAGQKASSSAAVDIPNELSASGAFKLQDQLRDLANLRKSTPNGLVARNGKSPVSTQRLENAARDAYEELNSELERVTTNVGELNSTDLKAQYGQYKQLQETLGKYFKDPESTYNTLRNLGKAQKKVLLETLNKVDAQLGTNTVSDAKLLDAFTKVGRNHLPPAGTIKDVIKSRAPATGALGAIGAYMGSKGGGGYGGAIGGGILGGGLGALIGSPSAMRMMIGANRSLSPAARQFVMPTWNLMQTEQEQK
jgi:hypothetical protein